MTTAKLPPPANGKTYSRQEMIDLGLYKPGKESKPPVRVKLPTRKEKPMRVLPPLGSGSEWYD